MGHLHFDFKEYLEAIHYWERMLLRDPSNIKALTSLGNCYRKLREYRKGVVYFQRALEMEDDNFYALFGLADCYRGTNEHEKSLHYWQRILENDPENKVIMTRAGDSYRLMGDYDNAEHYYREALNREFDSYAVVGLALINKTKGNHQEAIDSLLGLTRNEPMNARLYMEIADSQVALGDRSAAIETLTKYVRLGGRSSYAAEQLDRLKRSF